MDTRSARSRGAAAIVASMALLGSGAAITTSPAQSAPPAPSPDCAEAYPMADVAKGMSVEGLTVEEGTEPSEFAGSVIGVLDNGIAPGVDMILADLANPTGDPANDTRIDEVGGIWQGMSGSPVYTDDGRLLGAVSYGLSYGPSTVAGITPYEQMDDYLPGDAPERVAVSDAQARTIAARSDVSARQAGNGMKQLRVPLTINGISQSRLKKVRSNTERQVRFHKQGRAGTLVGSPAPQAGADDVVDGGNLGAAISYGTITAGGVGTVTDVCGADVVGFGHPMMFSGATSLGLMPADALLVQPESLGAPFKVANMGEPAGAITQDRLTGITGVLGPEAVPAGTDISSTVSYGKRSRTGNSTSMDQDWNTDVTIMQLLSMHDVTVDAIQPGSESSSMTLTGTYEGEDFTLTTGDRFVSDYDIAYEGIWPTAELLWAINGVEGLEITDITTENVVSDSTDKLRVGKIQQQRGGRWVTLGRRAPAMAVPGQVMKLRIALNGPDGVQQLRQDVRVPRKARNEGYLSVAGGAWTWNEDIYEADTLEEVQKAVAGDVRNDQVETRLYFFQRRNDIRQRAVSEPGSLVVEGERAVRVVVRR